MSLITTLLVAVAAAYFIPTLIAGVRSHPQTGAVFVLNLLLGWTFLGWVAALVWAVSSTQNAVVVVKNGEAIVQKPGNYLDRRDQYRLSAINKHRVSIGLEPLKDLSEMPEKP